MVFYTWYVDTQRFPAVRHGYMRLVSGGYDNGRKKLDTLLDTIAQRS